MQRGKSSPCLQEGPATTASPEHADEQLLVLVHRQRERSGEGKGSAPPEQKGGEGACRVGGGVGTPTKARHHREGEGESAIKQPRLGRETQPKSQPQQLSREEKFRQWCLNSASMPTAREIDVWTLQQDKLEAMEWQRQWNATDHSGESE